MGAYHILPVQVAHIIHSSLRVADHVLSRNTIRIVSTKMSDAEDSLGDLGDAGITEELGGLPQLPSLMNGMNLLETRMRRTRLRLDQETRGNSESISGLHSMMCPLVRAERLNGTAIVQLQERSEALRAELQGLRKELILQRAELRQNVDSDQSVGEYEEDSFLVMDTSEEESEGNDSESSWEDETAPSEDDTIKRVRRRSAIQEKTSKRRAVLEDSESD